MLPYMGAVALALVSELADHQNTKLVAQLSRPGRYLLGCVVPAQKPYHCLLALDACQHAHAPTRNCGVKLPLASTIVEHEVHFGSSLNILILASECKWSRNTPWQPSGWILDVMPTSCVREAYLKSA